MMGRGWLRLIMTDSVWPRFALVMLLAVSSAPLAAAGAAKAKIDLLVADGIVITMDGSRRVLAPGSVAIRGDQVVAVGSPPDVSNQFAPARTISAKGKIVLPGLINTHTHAPMVLFRGLANDVPLMEWLQKYIFPAEAKSVTRDFVEWGTALACLEMIRSGTTTFADMYYFEDQVAEVTERAGMRAVLGETVIGFPAPDAAGPAEALAYTESFIRRWKGNRLITPAVAPHAPYTNSAETLQACRRLADKYGVPLTIHVSETQDEVRQIREKYSMTSTQWLDSIGVLGSRVLFAHGVWMSEEDLALARARGVGVSHNPESNMMLASGTAPVVRMLALGLAVGLGTDGAVSNNNLDMFEAMDFAGKLHKLVQMNPTALTAPQLLEMATLGGARALGLDNEIGSLEAGKKADLILIDADSAPALPLYDACAQVVYSLKGAAVRTSIIDGRVVMIDGRVPTLDEPAIKAKAREYRERVARTISPQ
jgi:5-methylthioadenosine/S-adenosylhomocysteine deaminase